MTVRWEYLAVVYTGETNLSTKGSVEAEKWTQWCDIWRPGSSQPETYSLEAKNWLDIANELGADGWEMTSEIILEITIVKTRGWYEVSTPVRSRWTYRRQIS